MLQVLSKRGSAQGTVCRWRLRPRGDPQTAVARLSCVPLCSFFFPVNTVMGQFTLSESDRESWYVYTDSFGDFQVPFEWQQLGNSRCLGNPPFLCPRLESSFCMQRNCPPRSRSGQALGKGRTPRGWAFGAAVPAVPSLMGPGARQGFHQEGNSMQGLAPMPHASGLGPAGHWPSPYPCLLEGLSTRGPCDLRAPLHPQAKGTDLQSHT